MTDVRSRIDEIVKKNDIVLFMKGTALFPQCGFSSRAVAILDHLGVAFETVDVLQDPEIRQGIKDYSDWPTVPQLYVKGEFVGGSDIMMEMFEAGELQAAARREAGRPGLSVAQPSLAASRRADRCDAAVADLQAIRASRRCRRPDRRASGGVCARKEGAGGATGKCARARP